MNKYPRPANIMGLRAPRLNPLIRNQVSAQMRTQDSKYQETQQSLVAAIVAITKVTDSILKHNSGEKESLACLKDAIALTMNGLPDMNTIRRQAMKNDLHRDHAALCSSSSVESGSEFLFGDLSKLTKDISEANKVMKRVRPTGSTRGRRKAQSAYNPSYSGQRNCHVTPYSKSCSDFLYKSNPPPRSKKEGQGKN